MKRTQIYIDEPLDASLRLAAISEGRSAAALIRDAVRMYLASGRVPASDPLLSLAGAFEGGPADDAANHDRYLYRENK